MLIQSWILQIVSKKIKVEITVFQNYDKSESIALKRKCLNFNKIK